MTDHSLQPLIADIIERHGGTALWSRLQALDAEISAGGFLFRAKHRPILNHVRVRAETGSPHFTFFDFPAPGQRSELIGDDEVRLTGPGEDIIGLRKNPRRYFKGLRRQFFWDHLDFVYFAGYATWNYLITPFIFLHKGFRFDRVDSPRTVPSRWIVLNTVFPDDLPTHSRNQTFYFDEELLLRRLDYTAEVVGGWAHAAHFCEDYRDFGGLKIPTKRRVLPLLIGNKPLPGPTLVSIAIHDITLRYD